jgi:hypothetical protein
MKSPRDVSRVFSSAFISNSARHYRNTGVAVQSSLSDDKCCGYFVRRAGG